MLLARGDALDQEWHSRHLVSGGVVPLLKLHVGAHDLVGERRAGRIAQGREILDQTEVVGIDGEGHFLRGLLVTFAGIRLNELVAAAGQEVFRGLEFPAAGGGGSLAGVDDLARLVDGACYLHRAG